MNQSELDTEVTKLVAQHRLVNARPEVLHISRLVLGEPLDAANPAGRVLVEVRKRLYAQQYQHFAERFEVLAKAVSGRRKDNRGRVNIGPTYPSYRDASPNLFIGPFNNPGLGPRLQTAAATDIYSDECTGLCYLYEDGTAWREQYTNIWAAAGERIYRMAMREEEVQYLTALIEAKIERYASA